MSEWLTEPSVQPHVRVTQLPACMGGWCTSRDSCARHLTPNRHDVSERLCAKGLEMPEPIRLPVLRATREPVVA